ncbi:MAG: amidohydrolase family protein [Armatimonadetes bacterium]|nr:amidohydrolase family protein [Armatimonadota bacterium]
MSIIAATWGPDGFGSYEVSAGNFVPTSREFDTILAPGFVDIHIHGAFGLDWMTHGSACLPELADKLKAVGYEFFYPTTITYPLADIQGVVDSLPEHEMIPGFHLEGPFISPVFPGAQPPSSILVPAEREAGWASVLQSQKLKVITMAGELEGSIDLIRDLAGRGIRVSLGHTNATFAEASAARRAGAAHTTHTFNAMRPLHHREAGMVGFALAADEIACELIYDRKHVCCDATSLLLKTKPEDKVIAISDSTMASGMPSGEKMKMWGLDVVTGPQEVRLLDGTLAGSAVTLLEVFRCLAEDFGLETAMRLTSINPRRAMGLNPTARTYVELTKDLEFVRVHDFAS